MKTFVALMAVTAALAFSGCKQPEGGNCQVTDDCESGLVCNQLTGKCQSPGGVVDAPTDSPVDAPTDAAADAPADAPADSPTDAPVDSPSDAPNDGPVDAG